ncbi:unnamed protein product [Prorocentrum cordatum]|uniref:Uncharacterized protein n=1 Tax=Prorocentrum cordatum TaxID=2364126 RepID=A0ABN9W9X1_9DINO|nr:unnamed protein product [Polarella glacialis]
MATEEAQIEQERNEAAAAALHKGSGRGSNQGVKWGTPFKQTARHHSRRGARTAGPFGQCPCAALAIRQRGTIIGQFAVHQQAATSGRTRRGGEANGPNERERREERGGTGAGVGLVGRRPQGRRIGAQSRKHGAIERTYSSIGDTSKPVLPVSLAL